MKPVETFTLTSAEAKLRGLHPISQSQSNYAAVMSYRGQIIMHKWFDQYPAASLWALEHSCWKCNP